MTPKITTYYILRETQIETNRTSFNLIEDSNLNFLCQIFTQPRKQSTSSQGILLSLAVQTFISGSPAGLFSPKFPHPLYYHAIAKLSAVVYSRSDCSHATTRLSMGSVEYLLKHPTEKSHTQKGGGKKTCVPVEQLFFIITGVLWLSWCDGVGGRMIASQLRLVLNLPSTFCYVSLSVMAAQICELIHAPYLCPLQNKHHLLSRYHICDGVSRPAGRE